MIIMPVWIAEETNLGFWAIMGSEPDLNSEPIWIAREHVYNCVYAPCEAVNQKRLAVLTLLDGHEDERG